jgi:lysozyme
MKTGPKGLALIKDFEGCELKAYRCPAGILTIGYGSTGSHVKAGMVITEPQAEELLKKDLARFEKRVNDLVKVPLSQEQFDALVSFDFNTGALHKSTLLKKLNAGSYAAVPSELNKWVKAGGKTLKGLVRRRAAEGQLWSTKAMPAITRDPPDVEPVPNPPKTSWLAALAGFFKRSAA